jgi:hypothetical protein
MWLRLACLHFLKHYWPPEFPPSVPQLKQQVRFHTPALPNAGSCGSWNRLVGLLPPPPPPPPDIIFWSLWQTPSSGDWLQSVHCGRNKTPPRHEIASFCCVKLAQMTFQINLYELTAPFEQCILETGWMEIRGNCLRFWYRKCIKRA